MRLNSKCNYCKKNVKKCKCFVSDVVDDCINDFKKRELKNINPNNMFKYIYCSACDCTTFHLKTEDEEGWWFQCRICKKKEITKKMEVAKVGDLIEWDFKGKDYKTLPDHLRDKTFSSEVRAVLLKSKLYGVYPEYGQDLIPFNKCKIITKNK